MQQIKFINAGAKESPCCGTAAAAPCCPPASRKASYITGSVATPAGPVPVVSTAWTSGDRWGMVRSRIGAYRMRYTVEPGLYAVGSPSELSDVFVTANYKLSFDILRRELANMDAWVLVLDTKSINVWCAAGKGTFGTDELVNRMAATRIDQVVSHRRLILPQLGAVGVAAAEVRKRTGFRVSFGPVQARDIPAYVKAGYKKTDAMRTIEFPLRDRLILTPMELNPAFRKYPWFALAVLLVFGIQPAGLLFRDAFLGGLPFLLLGILSIITGAFLTPVLLPFIPFRSFALKGLVTGALATASAVPFAGLSAPVHIAAYLLFPAMTSYIALQFTGSTTYTGMSGVKKELKVAIPAYFTAAGAAVLLVAGHKLQTWGVL